MSNSIAQIRSEFEQSPESKWSSLYEKYSADGRSGVKKSNPEISKEGKRFTKRAGTSHFNEKI